MQKYLSIREKNHSQEVIYRRSITTNKEAETFDTDLSVSNVCVICPIHIRTLRVF